MLISNVDDEFVMGFVAPVVSAVTSVAAVVGCCSCVGVVAVGRGTTVFGVLSLVGCCSPGVLQLW